MMQLRSEFVDEKCGKALMDNYFHKEFENNIEVCAYTADGFDTFETGMDIYLNIKSQRQETVGFIFRKKKMVEYTSKMHHIARYSKNECRFMIHEGFEDLLNVVNEIVEELNFIGKRFIAEKMQIDQEYISKNKEVARQYLASQVGWLGQSE